MAYAIVWTPPFTRAARKFLRTHPDLRQRFERALHDLAQDPYQPHLRLHPLHGVLEGVHAVRVTCAYRITLTLRISDQEILLLDIGSHDDVYR